MKTDLFKFMALRAPDTTAMESRAGSAVADDRPFEGTAVGGILAETNPPKTESAVLKDVRDLVARARYAMDKRDPVLLKLEELFARHRRAFDGTAFQGGLRAALGAAPGDFVTSKALARLFAQTWDELYAFYILKRVEPLNLEVLLRDLRALELVKDIAAGRATPSAEVLAAYGAFPVVVPARLAAFASPARGGKPAASKPSAETVQRYDTLWREFGELYKSRKELANVKWEQKTVAAPPKSVVVKAGAKKSSIPSGKASIAGQTFQLAVSAKEMTRLSESTRQWFVKSRAAEGGVNLAILSDRLNLDLAALQTRILAIKDPYLFERLPYSEEWAVFFAPYADFVLAPGIVFGAPPIPDVFSRPLPEVKPLGVGDLKVVKQTFEKYTAGEIAHIENVLSGEYKERKHRQLNRSEEITTVEQETIEEAERDTQKTDRFDLKKESEHAIETDMRVQAGMTVSASYGPVSIGARADFAFGTSSRETSRSSSNFAQEVVSRAVDKIQKKAREERVKKILQETEETNLHGIDNKSGTGNVSGIYRWLDKHYKAQIHNYGRRLMFEFVLPEPAAFLRHSRRAGAAAPPGDFPPLVPLGSVTHRDIQDWNYHEYIQRYRIQGVLPPPPLYTTVAVSLASGDIPANVARGDTNKELNVPPGYVAKYWTGATQWSNWGGSIDLTLIVGNGNAGGVLNDEDTNVPIAIHMLQVAAYAATVEVHCERTARHFEEWQIKTYEKIVAAYRALVAEKENRAAAAAAPMQVVITGQNPRLNRKVEKTELKKNCITVLSNQYYGSFNAMSGTPPEINIPESLEEGKYIQFFEQAFEWEQMTYLFYPYFWGRKSQWLAMMQGADPDPLFDQFLKAGAARVLVPVHPIYNEAALYYLETGRVWNGGESPTIGDPLFRALYEELRDQQDDLEGAIPEGEPWNVIVPTSLVYLQPDYKLQTTNDDLNPPEA